MQADFTAPTQPCRVTVVGHLVPQQRHGCDHIVLETHDPIVGRTRQIMLQIATPFQHHCTIPIRIDADTIGGALLQHHTGGAKLRVTGRIGWEPYTPIAEGMPRKPGPITIHAASIEPATNDDQPGSAVWIEGFVRQTAHFGKHPHRPSLALALTTLRVHEPITYRDHRAHFEATHYIPVAIPLSHPDVTRLLNRGNQVQVEGVIERVQIRLSAEQIAADLAQIDAAIARVRELESDPTARQAVERRLAHARRTAGHLVRTRIIAGHVELLAGEELPWRIARRRAARALQNHRASTNTLASDAAATTS
ncbi:MAG TPA: hypothetical protein PKA05_04195 [Roseiflexaceae bacterium]|nr:hypothetical protein [Roseiflexaceae bacterium]